MGLGFIITADKLWRGVYDVFGELLFEKNRLNDFKYLSTPRCVLFELPEMVFLVQICIFSLLLLEEPSNPAVVWRSYLPTRVKIITAFNEKIIPMVCPVYNTKRLLELFHYVFYHTRFSDFPDIINKHAERKNH
jgi:hypothetical protein